MTIVLEKYLPFVSSYTLISELNNLFNYKNYRKLAFYKLSLKYNIGEQNLSPQNTFLWHEDFLELVNFKNQQTGEKL